MYCIGFSGSASLHCSSSLADIREHRLDINDRRAVDRLDWRNANALPGDLQHRHSVQPDRVWAIRRARGEYAGQWCAWVAAWVHLQHIAAGAVQPGQDNQLVASRDAGQPIRYLWIEIQP